MSTLIEKLREATKELKNEFLLQTEKSAEQVYSLMNKRSNWSNKQWCEFLGIEATEKGDFPRNFYNTVYAKRLSVQRDKIRSIVGIRRYDNTNSVSYQEFLSRELKFAERYYNNSLNKLCDRISKKGLNEETLEVKSAKVGVNIETNITDGVKNVRAWTIIASGDVQRPHYRYLVK
jgi:hypothetical protein